MPSLLDLVLDKVVLVIKKYGLQSPERLALDMGVVPLKVPFHTAQGMSFVLGCVKVVAIDDSLTPAMFEGRVLHEIAHQVFHPERTRYFIHAFTRYITGRYEAEVELFVLLYALAWNWEGFEGCGYNAYAFAEAYGVEQWAARYLHDEFRLRGPGFLRRLGLDVPGYGDVAWDRKRPGPSIPSPAFSREPPLFPSRLHVARSWTSPLQFPAAGGARRNARGPGR